MQRTNRRSRAPGRQTKQNLEKDDNNQLKQLVHIQNIANRIMAPLVTDILFPIQKPNKVFTFVRSYTTTQLTVATLIDTNFAYQFYLSLFPDYTEFTALFDQYRIGPVTVTFTPLGAAEAVLNTVIHTVIDYDDNTTLSTSALQEYSTHQMNGLGRMFQRTLQPRAANASYSGTFTSFSQMPPSTWIDAASPGVLYYGIKGQIPATVVVGGPFSVYDVQFTAVIQCRNSR